MAVSRKMRFEVFKRDEFRCGYCGKSPPKVILEIDHIQPKAKDGEDDINNLITACFDCNRGKGSIELKQVPTTIKDNLEVLKEKESQVKEYRKFVNKIERRMNKDIEDIVNLYQEYYKGWSFSENFKNTSLKRFLNLLPKHEVKDALMLSQVKFPENTEYNSSQAIRYFCGICWKKIKG